MKKYVALILTILCALALSGCVISEAAVGVPRPATTPAENSGEYIGEEAAKKIALDHAGLKDNEVAFVWVHLDYDDGRPEYDVEFYKDSTEYDYEIDAYTGDITSIDFDMESVFFEPPVNDGNSEQTVNNDSAEPDTPTQIAPVEPEAPVEIAPAEPEAPVETAPAASSRLSASEAKSIALRHAGVSSSKARFTECKLDYDDGYEVYDIEFHVGRKEYDLEIDAYSGYVLEYDAEIDD